MNVSDQNLFNVKCTACGACIAVCPVNAINLKENDEGFLYPSIDKNLCLDCGRCLDSCYIGSKMNIVKPIEIIFAYSKVEEIRKQSSSGGIFAHLAMNVIKKNGVVYGVSFDGLSHQACYSNTDNVSIESLMKSKYVEAYDYGCFKKIKKQLDSGIDVLFSGTPCKVLSLIKFLKKGYPNLTTIDFMCHGKPSPVFLKEVIKQEELITGKKCINVTFREKLKGWRNQVMVFYFDDGTHTVYDSNYYYYYYYFLHNYSLRKSCFSCECYQCHASDLTLADHWNVSKDIDDDKGISVIYVNTCKGKAVLEDLKNGIVTIENSYAYPTLSFAHSLKKGYNMNKRDCFFKNLKKYGVGYMKNEGYNKIIKSDKRKSNLVHCLVLFKNIIKNLLKLIE